VPAGGRTTGQSSVADSAAYGVGLAVSATISVRPIQPLKAVVFGLTEFLSCDILHPF
jgi:hypothetical protein